MLLKEKTGKHPKDLLKAIVRLSDNDDFREFIDYVSANKENCAQQSCISADDGIAKKYAGGFIGFLELTQLVEGSETELAEIVEKEKKC
jgi:hypothetical protein